MSDDEKTVRYNAVYEQLEFVPMRTPERLSRAIFDALDPGIAEAVAILQWHGIETCQSCEGAQYNALTKTWSGAGHCYPEPTVDFIDTPGAGMRAVGIAVMYGLPVAELRSKWSIVDGAIAERVGQLIFNQSIRQK